MSQRIPISIWLVTGLISVVVGIWLGFGSGQEHWNFLAVIFGWFYFFAGLGQLFTSQNFSFPQDQLFVWLLSWVYPLALVAYAICAYWTMRCLRNPRKALILVIVAAIVAILVSIPAAIITMSVNQQVPLLQFFLGYAPALSMHGILLIQLVITVVLSWLIGLALFRTIHRSRKVRTA